MRARSPADTLSIPASKGPERGDDSKSDNFPRRFHQSAFQNCVPGSSVLYHSRKPYPKRVLSAMVVSSYAVLHLSGHNPQTLSPTPPLPPKRVSQPYRNPRVTRIVKQLPPTHIGFLVHLTVPFGSYLLYIVNTIRGKEGWGDDDGGMGFAVEGGVKDG